MTDYIPNNRSVKLEGFSEFEDQLFQIQTLFLADTTARQTLVKAVKTAMQPVYDRVATTAPYNEKSTGPIHMRDTTKIESRIPNSRDKQSAYVNETDAAIAIVSVKKSAVSLANEFGTSKMSAQPFLRPALDSNMDNVLTILKSELGRIIPEYAAKAAKRKK